jgi:hypothetical protein
MPSFLQRMVLSDVITAAMRVSAQVAAAISRTGVASSHLVDLSIMVMM